MNEPQIRFKRFHGAWIPYTLGEMVTFSKGSGYSKTDLCKEGNPIILYGRMYTKYESVIDTVDTFVIPKNNSVYSTGGEVIIPGSGESPEDISVASTVKNAGVILGGDLNILKFDTKLYDPTFMAMAITYSPTRMQLSVFAQGKTIVHLRNNEIAKGYVYFPHIEEQKIIARYVSSLDTQISSVSSRLASLKQVKEASLQAMFPQKGETVPKIRFKGFEGEWTKVKLNDICFKKASNLSESSLGIDTGQYAVYGASGYLQNISTFDIPSEYVGIIKDGSGVGRTKVYPAFTSILGTMQYILAKEDNNIRFIAALFENIDFSTFISGSGIPHIYFRDYGEIYVMIPSLVEQQAIASYFTSLDKQIALQTQRLEKLKQIKAACLDKMFV
jgi:hypothetical protein